MILNKVDDVRESVLFNSNQIKEVSEMASRVNAPCVSLFRNKLTSRQLPSTARSMCMPTTMKHSRISCEHVSCQRHAIAFHVRYYAKLCDGVVQLLSSLHRLERLCPRVPRGSVLSIDKNYTKRIPTTIQNDILKVYSKCTKHIFKYI